MRAVTKTRDWLESFRHGSWNGRDGVESGRVDLRPRNTDRNVLAFLVGFWADASE